MGDGVYACSFEWKSTAGGDGGGSGAGMRDTHILDFSESNGEC